MASQSKADPHGRGAALTSRFRDIDATSGLQKRIDIDVVVREIRRAGREFNVRQDREPERTPGGSIVHLRFDSLTDAGTAKGRSECSGGSGIRRS